MSEPLEPNVNIPLLRKHVEWVEWQEQLPESDPRREWHQSVWAVDIDPEVNPFLAGVWSCGTARCFAGNIALEAGWKIGAYDGQVTKDGFNYSAEEAALELLNLDDDHGLFYAGNTAKDIRSIAEEIAGERL